MKQNQNPEDVFNLLENADDETLLHLSEHYLSADPDEMEKIFSRSEQKYEMKTQKQNPEQEIQESVPEKSVKNSGFYQSILAAAACLIVTFGAVSGIVKLNAPPSTEPNPVAENLHISEICPETEAVSTFPQFAAENIETETDKTDTETSLTTEQPLTVGTDMETTMFLTTETTQTVISVSGSVQTTVRTETVSQTILPESVPNITEQSNFSEIPPLSKQKSISKLLKQKPQSRLSFRKQRKLQSSRRLLSPKQQNPKPNQKNNPLFPAFL